MYELDVDDFVPDLHIPDDTLGMREQKLQSLSCVEVIAVHRGRGSGEYWYVRTGRKQAAVAGRNVFSTMEVQKNFFFSEPTNN